MQAELGNRRFRREVEVMMDDRNAKRQRLFEKDEMKGLGASPVPKQTHRLQRKRHKKQQIKKKTDKNLIRIGLLNERHRK